MVNDLIDFVIDRHGGLDRWRAATNISATVRIYGAFWPFKGQPDRLGVEAVTADLRGQRISLAPFGENQVVDFDAEQDRVRISDGNGEIRDELSAPRRSMAGFTSDTPWTATQTGYFISYASWMYLLEPYLFTLPGVTSRELEPWQEVGETWRRLEVTFPDGLSTHSRVQTYYFDADTGLQRRMDYSPDVNGNPLVAHYTTEHHDFGGLIVPTRRRVLLRDEDGVADQSFCAILLDVSDVRLNP
ncbi:hypothetical protein VSH64_18510 [Amycolatopsis rhabdoformis]|uniref:DUF3386 family protein n=1 Tax=Amycolatopsis rhabdoformis TaxID=1448059 RepID=A0ABZ1IHX5_9PSEU|nr:hypothetical protein [Amycolatopsis rhabdoformis]WSE34065.1 hypothetical protein VSH64_18510 [Amycolatopsis rhabdoformis]